MSLIDDQRFISEHGYLKPNSWDKQSENGLLFTVQHDYLKSDIGISSNVEVNNIFLLFAINLLSNDFEFRTLPNDPNPRFSLDNMIAVAGYSRKHKRKDILRKLPLFKKYSIRPDNFAYLLYCKYPLIGFWFLWIVSISMIISCARTDNGTSGKLLAYTKHSGINMRTTWWLCGHFLSMNMKDAFQVYYPEYDHPSNILARQLWL